MLVPFYLPRLSVSPLYLKCVSILRGRWPLIDRSVGRVEAFRSLIYITFAFNYPKLVLLVERKDKKRNRPIILGSSADKLKDYPIEII